ncbi:hypothetical protein [Litorimonas sp. WD9-15]|uniref:hypothetical protein n=1 Tax=Litorimonas sp. WD9-15 TaxID=3418716 RepID=UPI003D04554C
MKPFFKPSILKTVLVTSAIALGACSKATPETLIVGDWKQGAPITIEEAGTTVSMTDTNITYAADGTSKGDVQMTLSGVPADFASYMISTTGTWKIEDGMLIEGISDIDVKPGSNAAQAIAIAAQMETAMAAEVESRSEIKTLTKDSLVVYQAETDLTMNFTR